MSLKTAETEPEQFDRKKWRFRIKTEESTVYPPPYLNPWLRLTVYIVIIILSGCVYWGWNGMQVLLYKAGSFEDLCKSEQNPTYINIGGIDYIDCGERKSAINNLFTIAYSTQLISSIFTGMILDYIGPKLCFMLGQGINFVVWILMSSSPKNPSILRMCFFFIGFTTESMYIPLTTVSHYFPGNQSLILSIMGSFRSISIIIPVVMSKIYGHRDIEPEQFYKIGIGYAVSCVFVCFSMGSFLLQSKFYTVKSDEKEDDEKDQDSIRTESISPFVESTVNLEKCLKSLTKTRTLLKHPQLTEFLLLVVLTSLFLTTIEFINKSHRDLLATTKGDTAADVFKYIHTLSFIPGPMLGYLMDKFGAAFIFVFLQLSCLGYFLCVITDFYPLKVLACILFLFAFSLCISDTYCYIRQRFSPLNFGVLNGTCLLAAGLLTFTNIPLYNFSAKKLAHLSPNNFIPAILILMGYEVVCILVSLVLVYKSKKSQNTVKTRKDYIIQP